MEKIKHVTWVISISLLEWMYFKYNIFISILDISYMDQWYPTWETVKSWIFGRFLVEKYRKI